MTRSKLIMTVVPGMVVLAIILAWKCTPWVYCVSERQHFGPLHSFPMPAGLKLNVWINPSIQERFNSRPYEYVRTGPPFRLTIQAIDKGKHYSTLTIREIVETYSDGSAITNEFRGTSKRLHFSARNEEDSASVCEGTGNIPHKHTHVVIHIIGTLSTVDGQNIALNRSLSFVPDDENEKRLVRWSDRIIY